MENSRRNFIKKSGTALTGWSMMPSSTPFFSHTTENVKSEFNMSGYAAPILDTVRIGFIGIGNRGMSAVKRMCKIEGVEIKALCDLRPERVREGMEYCKEFKHFPDEYSGTENIWKKVCERKDIDLIYILTPWRWHTPMALMSMENDKHVCVEVPAAQTIEDCWKLVETSEKTRKHCMMTENCCYDFEEMLMLNMARDGFFGEIIHCEGAYIHDLKEYLFDKDRFYQMWELHEMYKNTGNLYPTHGLGPICQILDINRGDRMEFLVSVSSADFSLNKMALEKSKTDSFYNDFVNQPYNGNINTTTIKTRKGKTIVVQYDVSSTRPYSRIHLVSGTEGMARKFPKPVRFSRGHEWISDAEIEKLKKVYEPPIISKIGEIARNIGGHGGMDFIMDWRTIDCLRNGIPLDQDVYDAALWSSVFPLSIQSVSQRSRSVDVPDFTRGEWVQNQPVDISMKTGGNTKIKAD